ncbi:hypothetical protein CRV00_11815 [Malaciobacter molluscorum]|uniref:phage major tropism determinant n=1 Tax=Malaciobacter molluscorum TaxID=1032072 RepID=UPI00100A3CD2|nr:hypothetical protein [Malaciobacter molluscorum]RXJ93331.1 hypothetical protein CRV00_11815 [Malaciobacter molluscorum]
MALVQVLNETLSSILSCDDTSLDQLQDIVNYIKENRKRIESLSAYDEQTLDKKLDLKVNISDIVDNLLSTLSDVPLSANQGRVLDEKIKIISESITSIKTLLASDDTSLDELQKIVNFIKQNRDDLSTLDLSNIAETEELKHFTKELKNKVETIDNKIDIFKIDVYNKPNFDEVLFIKSTPSSLIIPKGFTVKVDNVIVEVSSNTTLDLDTNLDTGSKIAGTDYVVYAKKDGTFYLSVNEKKTEDRLIGGFHYGLIGHTEIATGNKTEADMAQIRGINAYSFWDLKFRPVASPKGMVFIKDKWYDIYLCNSEHITNGTSKALTTIAGGTLTNGRKYPKMPLEFGGDNTLTYESFKWFHACEIAKANAKQLIDYAEFQTIAYGVQEGVDASAVDGDGATVEHYDYLTSKWGIEQASGTQWIWGNDLTNGYGTTSFSWKNNTENRGQIYATANAPVAVIFGGDRANGMIAGSRASNWNNYVWNMYWNIGCRFSSEHKSSN